MNSVVAHSSQSNMNTNQHQHHHQNSATSSSASHYVFGGGSSQATSTLQALPNTSSLLSGGNVVGNQQQQHHTNNNNGSNVGGPQQSTSIQMQLQQLQQYQQQQQRFGNGNNTNQQQQLPSLTSFSQQHQLPLEDDQLIDWINEHPSTRMFQQQQQHSGASMVGNQQQLQQGDIPPFESDFGFDGWFQSEENVNNVLAQQFSNNNGYFQNTMMGGNNQNYNHLNNSMHNNGMMPLNGQGNFVLDDQNFNAWAEAGELDLDKPPSPLMVEGLLSKQQHPLFGGSQLFTNHTISTTESKGVTSITALANSLNFTDSPPQVMRKSTRKTKKSTNVNNNNGLSLDDNNQYQQQQHNFDVAYDQNLLDMDNDNFKNYVLMLYGENGKKKNKTQVPFSEEDYSKLLLAKDRITELYQQCQHDNMSLVNSVMSQYTPSSMEMDDALSNEMKELYSKVNAKLDYKNNENKNHCEQVLKKLILEWIEMVKTQKSVVISDKASNDSSTKSSKKSKSTNRRLPNEAKKVLENWFLEHYKHPYPTNEEKQWLSDQTQLNLTQINNWFINKRGRSLKLVKEKLKTETDDGEEE